MGRQTKFVIVYQTDNNDLYSEVEVADQDAVDAWLAENEEYKAIVIEVEGCDASDLTIKIHDRT